MGIKLAESVLEAGGTPILWDIAESVKNFADELSAKYHSPCLGMRVDITSHDKVMEAFESISSEYRKVDILINNAANDPKVLNDQNFKWSRFENFSLEMWEKDIAVGLSGAFICSQIVGAHMAENHDGVILNIASDLGIIAPDQRIYRKESLAEHEQPVKPVTYSVIKHGLIGLTKYMATYWADKNIRVNSISPGGIFNGQPEDFVTKLTNLIPMGRMADKDEYKAAVLFLISDASSYMTGANLQIDGGRTCW